METDFRSRDPLIGTLLAGRYRIDSRIAAGGMSTVYVAFDQTLDRRVAIKVLHREISELPDQIERFRREARAAAALSHPNVVTVIDAGEDERHPFIVFEYVDGETLKARIRRLGRLGTTEAVAYAIGIGRALAAAHASKLIHRDVKPQNVLIDAEGRAKVTDFGIARSLDASALTATGRVLGTTDYVSPEQALGHAVDGRSDVYSLGIVLWEMLTGEVPFRAPNPVGVAMKHVRETIPDVQRRRPEVSSVLAAIVERATFKQPENRYPTAEAMVEDLEDALSVETARMGVADDQVTSVLEAVPERRRRRPLLARPVRFSRLRALMLLALMVIAAVTAVALFGGGGGGSGPALGEAKAIPLRDSAAKDYDPDGDGSEHPDEVGLAVDGDPTTTAWSTETYTVPDLGSKPGVGLYVDAGRPVSAKAIEVRSKRAGWAFEVRAAAGRAPAELGGWKLVGKAGSARTRQTVELRTGSARFRYYLIWITRLAPSNDGHRVEISNVRLFA